MSEIKKILESGLLESYCLGAVSKEEKGLVEKYMKQFPEIDQEVEMIRQSIENYASLHALEPSKDLKAAVLSKIDSEILKNSEKQWDLKDREISDKVSLNDWEAYFRDIQPPDDFDIYLHPIYESEDKLLFCAWVKDYVPPEVHEDLYESFLILEGSCRCKIGEEYVNLKAGDYFNIPLYIEHSIKVTSDGPVRAILQRKFVA